MTAYSEVPLIFIIIWLWLFLCQGSVGKLLFLILGSASRDLIRQSSETLAGRIAHLELTPFFLSGSKRLNSFMVTRRFSQILFSCNQ